MSIVNMHHEHRCRSNLRSKVPKLLLYKLLKVKVLRLLFFNYEKGLWFLRFFPSKLWQAYCITLSLKGFGTLKHPSTQRPNIFKRHIPCVTRQIFFFISCVNEIEVQMLWKVWGLNFKGFVKSWRFIWSLRKFEESLNKGLKSKNFKKGWRLKVSTKVSITKCGCNLLVLFH